MADQRLPFSECAAKVFGVGYDKGNLGQQANKLNNSSYFKLIYSEFVVDLSNTYQYIL